MLTKYFKYRILQTLGGFYYGSTGNVPVGYYMGLSTTTPTIGTYNSGTISDCNFTEPTDSNYKRILFNTSNTGHPNPAYPFRFKDNNEEIENSVEIHFNAATENWGVITHIGIFDNSGHLLAFASLNTPITVNTGYVVTIPVGDALISIEPEE